MTGQLDLLGGASVSRPSVKRSSGVVSTSVLAYQSVDSAGRMKLVVGMVRQYRWSHDQDPTVRELADSSIASARRDATAWKQHLACGLSEALAHGLVEHGESRACSISGRKSLVWKLKTR